MNTEAQLRLREKFHKETGMMWENSDEEPDIDYVEWLEAKVIAVQPDVSESKLQIGEVVYLKDFTAPKVFTGLFFECLLTDQKIAMAEKLKITKKMGHIKNWKHEIWNTQRFATYFR